MDGEEWFGWWVGEVERFKAYMLESELPTLVLIYPGAVDDFAMCFCGGFRDCLSRCGQQTR